MKSENRLRKRKHFNYIYKNGESRFSSVLQMVFIKNKIKPFKVGFSVSKKIGKSVVRNKVKRRLREIVRAYTNNINQNYNYIFVAKKGIEEKSFEELKQEVKNLLLKANLYEENN